MRGIESEQGALYEIASGIITYFLHGSSHGLIRMMVLRTKNASGGMGGGNYKERYRDRK